jgi:glucan phosphorylase
LNLSILDGWWAQAYIGQNGFAIGSQAYVPAAGGTSSDMARFKS